MDKPVILTAGMARILSETPVMWEQTRTACHNIATGHTVCVPRISETEAREPFEEKYGDDFIERRGTCEWVAWLAALRHYGILLPTVEKGT